ncbi:MAG: ABC transporter ATP-binding protein [Bacteroidia bacterium]
MNTTFQLETRNLSHHFSASEQVLTNINLQVHQSSIYGFLGPNGAGKTTTLKLILGLIAKQQGEVFIAGKLFDKNRIELLHQIGSLIETPSLYSQLTAKENLAVWQKIYQCPQKRIDEVLEQVRLSDTGKKKAGQFSLGMKQRLSIAVALLHNPSILILDEPTNGLDPNGILEMRALLRQLNQEKKMTILVSSHLLSEIEKLVTHVGIINKGNILFQGTLPELMQKQEQAAHIVLATNNNQHAATLIDAQLILPSPNEHQLFLKQIPHEQIAMLNKKLVENGIDVYEIRSEKTDLETIFMNLTNN